jgi:hypothetical protein
MAQPLAETGRSLDQTSVEFGEAPTLPFLREPLAKEQLYPRHADVFVAPPWRWSDWSWAILAAVGGVMSAITLLVLLSTTQLATDNGQFAPATSVMAVATRAATPRPAPVEAPAPEPAPAVAAP